MEPEEIQSELFKVINGSNAWQSLRHLMLKLKTEDSEKVLDALLGIFFGSSNNHFRGQSAAGGLLWKLKPKYERNLREDIKRSLQTWDVSIEELPWYFAEAIGIEKVRDEIESLLTETLDETSRKRAETYLYWLSVSSPEEFKVRLNQTWNGRLRG
jgi:hypothetical protein